MKADSSNFSIFSIQPMSLDKNNQKESVTMPRSSTIEIASSTKTLGLSLKLLLLKLICIRKATKLIKIINDRYWILDVIIPTDMARCSMSWKILSISVCDVFVFYRVVRVIFSWKYLNVNYNPIEQTRIIGEIQHWFFIIPAIVLESVFFFSFHYRVFQHPTILLVCLYVRLFHLENWAVKPSISYELEKWKLR